jgi:hypothetical protein
MKNQIVKIGLSTAILLVFVVACNTDKSLFKIKKKGDNAAKLNSKSFYGEDLSIKPAFNGLDLPFKNYSVDASKEQKIFIEETGTEITIPANSFTDMNGNPIKGKVQINFREFHDASEIIMAGIPMHNPDNGAYMESAGMFEIRGKFNGQDIKLKDDKRINVNMASYRDGNQYDFFKLGDDNGRWKTLSENDEPKINLKRKEELEKIKKQRYSCQPVEPVKMGSSNKFIFDMDVDYKKFPELSVFKGVVWQFSGNAQDADNPEKNASAFETEWNRINLEQSGDHYKLEMKNGDKSFTTRVKPVLKGKDYEKAKEQFNKKLADYDKLRKELDQRDELIKNQANFQRMYEISGLGTYNCDVWKNEEVSDPVEVKVDFEESFDYAENMPALQFFLVNKTRNAVVRYSLGGLNNFRMPLETPTSLIAILPGNRVAYIDSKEMSKVGKNIFGKDKIVVKMKTSPIMVNNLKDISNILTICS